MPTTSAKSHRPRKPAADDSRTLLKSLAYERLKSDIVEGLFVPGSFLSERRLVEQLGMSKTPIRAALERLEGEGYVRVSPRQGIVVREPSFREVSDQFEIRLALERYVIEALAGSLSTSQIRELRGNLQRQRQAAARDDLRESIRLDSEFHIALCRFHGNQEIVTTMLRLREKMTWVIGLVFKQNDGRMIPNLREHEAIAKALIAGDREEAVARLRSHLNYGRQSLLGHL